MHPLPRARRAAALVLACVLLATVVRAGPVAPDDALTLFLRDDGTTRALTVADGPDAADGHGPALVAPAAALGWHLPIDTVPAYASGPDVPEIQLAPEGEVEVTLYVRATVRTDAHDAQGATEESLGYVSLYLRLDAGELILGGCRVEHLFTGETGFVPLRCAFQPWPSPPTSQFTLRILPEVALVASLGYGLDGDHASRLRLPVGTSGSGSLSASIGVARSVVEDVPATFEALVEGGSAPFAYLWSFGDGAGSTEASAEHAFLDPGVYRVSLRVEDAQGRVASAAIDVRVHQRDHVHGPRVVVAVIDTGVNPYHEAFRREGILVPTGDFVDAATGRTPRAVPLTFGDDYEKSVVADDAAWSSVRPRELVVFEGTNLLGISFLDAPQVDLVAAPSHLVRDTHGHGTATASTILHAAPDALVVSVQVAATITSTGVNDAYAWAASQPWIDVVSMSIGMPGNLPLPALGGVPAASRDAWAAGKLLVTSAGNDPSPLVTDFSDGAPWIISVTGTQRGGESRELLASTAYPDVASNYTVEAASAWSVEGDVEIGGTSFSAPTVAGALAASVHALRANAGWHGGIEGGLLVPPTGVDNHLVRAAMNKTALYHEWSGYVAGFQYNGDVAVLPVVPFAEVGWGHVDARIVPELVAVVESRDLALPPPPSPKALAAPVMQASYAARAAMWSEAQVGMGLALAEAARALPAMLPEAPVEQDDAGTGADAPHSFADDLFVAPGVVHRGALLGPGLDAGDVYAVALREGERLHVRSGGQLHCLSVHSPSDHEWDVGCAAGSQLDVDITVVAPVAGVWHVLIDAPQPESYAFSYAVDGDAPEPHP